MKMDIILSKWCLAILFALGILACTDGSDANELPKEPEGTGETQDEKIPAFPGAEGHGRYTTGGRGGDVYIVTSLEDKLQNGTLRYGIEKLSGKRTIIFQVSGTIHLNGDLKIKKEWRFDHCRPDGSGGWYLFGWLSGFLGSRQCYCPFYAFSNGK